MSAQTYTHWYEGLPDEKKQLATRLLAQFRAYGANEPETWVESEVEENIAQLARFIFLRSVLNRHVNQWKEMPHLWINACKGEPQKNLYAPFPDVGSALTRMLEAGISTADIAAVARMTAYATAWDILHQIDSGSDPDSEGAPGWVLIETDPNGEQTGRDLGGLHEDMLTMMEELLEAESKEV